MLMESELKLICIQCGLHVSAPSENGKCNICNNCCKICGAQDRFCQNPDLISLAPYPEIFNEIMHHHRKLSDELWWFSRLDAINQKRQNAFDSRLIRTCKYWCETHAPRESKIYLPDPAALFQPDYFKCEFQGCKHKASHES